jgi:hypothetical protein
LIRGKPPLLRGRFDGPWRRNDTPQNVDTFCFKDTILARPGSDVSPGPAASL